MASLSYSRSSHLSKRFVCALGLEFSTLGHELEAFGMIERRKEWKAESERERSTKNENVSIAAGRDC